MKLLHPAYGGMVGLVLLGAGCLRAKPQVSAPVAERAWDVQRVSARTPLALDTVKIDRDREAGEGTCEFGMEYPLVASGTSPEAKAAINAEIETLLIPSTGTSTTSTATGFARAEQAAEDYLGTCVEDIADALRKFPDSASSKTWDSRIETIVHANDGKLLSLEFVNSWFSGGAHPNHGSIFRTFDARTGERLKTGDIFKSGRLHDFQVLEKKKLIEVAGKDLFDENKKKYETLVTEIVGMPAAEQALLYGGQENFFLDISGSAFVTVYGPYEIAPYAAGDIKATLPFSGLASMIDPHGPASYLVNQ